MRSLVCLVAALVVSCDAGTPSDASVDDDAGADAAEDAALVTPITFDATPDAAERTDCVATIALGSAIAKHVTCAGELIDGALAMGRVGDVVIANAHARFVIRTGTESASTIGGFAGGIVDASIEGGDDAIKEIFPLVDFGVARASEVVVTDAGGDADAAVTVLFDVQPLGILAAAAPGLSRERPVRGGLEYRLAADARVLEITMRYSSIPGDRGTLVTPGLAALLGGNGELERPGAGLIPTGGGGNGVAAVVSEGARSALAIALDADVGALLAVSTIHLLSGTRGAVAPGVISEMHARVAVAETAAAAWSLAAATEAPTLVVRGAAGDRVEIADASSAFLRTRIASDGTARLPVPAGDYTVRGGYGSFFPGAAATITVGASGGDIAVPAPPSATLHVEASADGDATAPVRVTLRDPATSEERLRFVALGSGDARVPPGSYVVDVSHGIEHDVYEASVTLADGETRSVTALLDRALDTTGFIGCDFHLHSDLSTDSVHHVVDAVRTIAAEGLDLVASTDHDYVTDYDAILARVGLTGRVVVVPGDEVSSTVLGHFGGYPLARDVDAAGAGAPVWFDRSPADVFALIEARGDATLGGAIVQINHPRLRGTSFFDVIGLDPTTAHATASPTMLGLPATTDLDDLSAVDVIEAWNGYTRGDNEAAFADVLALWDAGRRFTMVGNSDSHRADLPAGAPRTFLRVADDTPGGFGWSDAASALHAHDATVAAGIFVTAELAGPRDASGSVPLHVRVQAAPWAATDRLRVYAGRDVVVDLPLSTGANVRYDDVVSVPLGGAHFVVARADGDRDAEPLFPFHPFGVTNPIEVP